MPFFGESAMKSIDIPVVCGWLTEMTEAGLSLTYQQLLFDRLSSILNAAVEEKIIRSNARRARSVQRPSPPERRVKPWPEKRLNSIRLTLPARYKPAAALRADARMRQGEIFAFSPDDIDREARELHIVRQVWIVKNALVFARPKSKKERTTPAGDGVLDELDDYLEELPAGRGHAALREARREARDGPAAHGHAGRERVPTPKVQYGRRASCVRQAGLSTCRRTTGYTLYGTCTPRRSLRTASRSRR
ncbi:hypothetical protein ACVDFE_01685 [Lentzea chajnantorensis]